MLVAGVGLWDLLVWFFDSAWPTTCGMASLGGLMAMAAGAVVLAAVRVARLPSTGGGEEGSAETAEPVGEALEAEAPSRAASS